MTSTPGNFIPEDFVIPDNDVEFDLFLKNTLIDHAKLINRKDTGTYDLVEQQINQQYFGSTPQAKRQVFRKVINTGTLPNAAASAVAHGLGSTANWTFTRLYGFAQDPTTPIWIPIPNSGPAYQVQLHVTTTQIILTTAVNLNAFTNSYVVLEYLKN